VAGEAGEGEVVRIHEGRGPYPGGVSVVRQVARTAGSEPRPPGSDAEREAARRLAAWLRARGDAAEVRTRRVRPAALGATGVGAAVAAAGSLVSVASPAAGVAGAAAALVVLALEAAGLESPARLLFRQRAVADVVVGGRDRPVLLVCAGFGSGRLGWGARRRLGAWPVLVAAAVVAACVARALGAAGVWLGAAQLVPTLFELVVATAALDAGLAGWGPGEATAAAVAVAVHDELAARPPATLEPALLLHGDGRPRLDAAVKLEVRPGAGVTARDPAVERATEALGLPPPRRRGGGIVIGTDAEDQETLVDLALAIVDALDQSRAQASSPPTTATTP
jgi:hypothetical protein